jgi:hypothetical protein
MVLGATRISDIRSAERGAKGGVQPADLEPVSRFEPLTCRLQEVRPRPPSALAAQITRVVALRALAAVGLSDTPFHGLNAWTVLLRYFL